MSGRGEVYKTIDSTESRPGQSEMQVSTRPGIPVSVQVWALPEVNDDKALGRRGGGGDVASRRMQLFLFCSSSVSSFFVL